MNKVQKGYLEKNILLIEGEVDEEMIKYVEKAISTLYLKGSPEITILITSNGGSVGNSLVIVDILSLYPGKKTAIVLRFARSMAAIILQVCDERKAMTHSKIRIHYVGRRIGLDIIRDRNKLENVVNDLEKDQEKLDKILVQTTKKSALEIHKECEKDKDMTVDEAIAFGLLDGIHQGPLPK